MIDRRSILFSTLLGIGGLGTLAVHPSLRYSARAGTRTSFTLPGSFEAWRALPAERVILPPADAMSAAAYQNLHVGAYADGHGPAIVVLVAAGAPQTYSLQLHRPELCYPSSGFSITSQRVARYEWSGRSIAVNWLEARRGSRTDRLLYFTRLGDEFVTSMWEQRLEVARQALSGQAETGVLVRISAETIRSRYADRRLTNFAERWLAAMPAADRAALLGRMVAAT